jgi:hypothetical protein
MSVHGTRNPAEVITYLLEIMNIFVPFNRAQISSVQFLWNLGTTSTELGQKNKNKLDSHIQGFVAQWNKMVMTI